jgi:hypothetical protein
VADDHDSWGKTAARTPGLTMREESPIGGAERWLAGGEGMAVAHLSIGGKQQKGGSFGFHVLL